MIKADAYGHGLVPVAKCIQDDVDELAVAHFSEAESVAASGFGKQINILNSVTCKTALKFNYYNIHPTVCTLQDVEFLQSCGFTGSVNIKINSGMNRVGVLPSQFDQLFKLVLCSKMFVKSAYTHFAQYTDKQFTENQFELFNKTVSPYRSYIGQFHVCASSCLYLNSYYHLDMVRTGLSMYGYGHKCLQPAMSVSANILQIFEVKAGQRIGYGAFQAQRAMQLATVQAGYADGFRRIVNNNIRCVSIRGCLCPVVGQVSMDMFTVDVSGIGASVCDCVNILDDIATCDALAKSYNTINYEVLTGFSKRAPRRYIGQIPITKTPITSALERYLNAR